MHSRHRLYSTRNIGLSPTGDVEDCKVISIMMCRLRDAKPKKHFILDADMTRLELLKEGTLYMSQKGDCTLASNAMKPLQDFLTDFKFHHIQCQLAIFFRTTSHIEDHFLIQFWVIILEGLLYNSDEPYLL